MVNHRDERRGLRRVARLVALLGVVLAAMGGCARLPYTVATVHEDSRVSVTLKQEVEPVRYTHPVDLTIEDLVAILKGLSIRKKVGIPLRWFAEEKVPVALFREHELRTVAPYLVEGLKRVGPGQRVAFEAYSPGYNPAVDRDVVGGWLAVREPFLFVTIEYFHVLLPTHRMGVYETADRYPTPPPPPKSYTVFFEPGRFWSKDPETGEWAVEFRAFLKARPPAPPGAPSGSSPAP